MTGNFELLERKCDPESYRRLATLRNEKLHAFVDHFAGLCRPDSIFVGDDSPETVEYIRRKAVEKGEEKKLKLPGQTIHFDGPYDQARDKDRTKYLLPPEIKLGSRINFVDEEKGLAEMDGLLEGSMEGREMLLLFFCLGPVSSEFAIPCVQITDSFYVAHSETILYRAGYEYFKSIGNSRDFFRFIHGAGELEYNNSRNVDRRRIYIDVKEEMVLSVNTQYAGNTVGLKKLALRLAIRKAAREDWLAEHMLLMGVHGPQGRVTYFSGAFPSACGKTSTAMCPGETIVGDDIAYLRERDGKCYAANVECGIFGIIKDVSEKDDPVIWEALTTPGEVIFSNVLVTEEGIPYWLGDGREVPAEGVNFVGPWKEGQEDDRGNPIPHSHKNARYTLSISRLKNRDKAADDPRGVKLGGVLFGGRDSDTCVPVERAFDWAHGVLTKGAALESETTAATLGREGVRKFNLMSNLDFLAIPLGKYIESYLAFGEKLEKAPVIFSVNYFLRGPDGKYLNAIEDKRVWLKWAELSVNGDVEAITTPTGYIPEYADLKRLFQEVLGKDYSEEDYVAQFTIRVAEGLAKIDRIEKIYREQVDDTPEILFEVFRDQRARLEAAREKYGDHISPFSL